MHLPRLLKKRFATDTPRLESDILPQEHLQLPKLSPPVTKTIRVGLDQTAVFQLKMVVSVQVNGMDPTLKVDHGRAKLYEMVIKGSELLRSWSGLYGELVKGACGDVQEFEVWIVGGSRRC